MPTVDRQAPATQHTDPHAGRSGPLGATAQAPAGPFAAAARSLGAGMVQRKLQSRLVQRKPGDGAAAGAGAADGAATARQGNGKVLMGRGAFGAKVKDLTKQLRRAGFDVAVDVNYGKGVEAAVRALQQREGIEPATGKYDEATKEALDRLAPIIPGPATLSPRDPRIDKLLSGAYAGEGAYKDTQDGFVNAELQALLEQYGTFWAVDVHAAPKAQEPAAGGEAKPQPPGGGDSAGKAVAAHPPWVGKMQGQLIEEDKWTEDHAATQRLLQAFLMAFTRQSAGKVHSSVEAFYGQVGKSEMNGQTAKVFNAPKGSADWCAQASSYMLVVGLYKKGVRFKTGSHSKQALVELSQQAAALERWTNKASGAKVSGSAAWTAALDPGDIISIVNGGAGPLSGHVATVVEQKGDRIRIVSGNAGGGEGSARAEEVARKEPPSGYSWDLISAVSNAAHAADGARKAEQKAQAAATAATDDKREKAEADLAAATSKREAAEQKAEAQATAHPDIPTSRTDSKFKPGVHAPARPGESWVVSIIKASRLDANTLVTLSDEALGKEGLERCQPLDELYPEFGKAT